MVLPPGFSRETRIRRDRYGQWFDGDQPVTNRAIATAFDRWIDLAPDGRFCLSNSINWAYVEIEGAPIFVRAVEVRESGVALSLSDGRREELDPSTLFTDGDGRLLCRVRSLTMQAEFTSTAMMQLEPSIDEDDEGAHLLIAGAKIRIARAPGSGGSPLPPRS